MKTIRKEVILMFLVGVFPVLIIYFRGGVNSLKSFINFSIPPETIFFYFLAFFLAHALLAYISKPYIGNVPLERRDRVKQRIILFGDVGAGLLGIYRLVSGILLAGTILWKLTDPNTLTNMQFIGMLLISILFFTGVCLMSYFHNLANEQL